MAIAVAIQFVEKHMKWNVWKSINKSSTFETTQMLCYLWYASILKAERHFLSSGMNE